jgi:lysophospholipase L1-like esterase
MRFAALGDSVTLGIGDQMPQGGWRGWAALLAGSLAPPDQVELCNLAQSGALVRDVASEQLPLALSVRPALASVLVGVNDTLRGKFDPAAIAADLENTVAALQHAGTVVLTASLPDPGLLLRIPASIRHPLARRAHQINAVLGQLAVRYDLVHVDLAAPGDLRQADVGSGPAAPQRARAPDAGPDVRGAAGGAGHAAAGPARPGASQPRAERLAPGSLDGHQRNRLDGQAIPGPAAGAAPAGPGRVVARRARAPG